MNLLNKFFAPLTLPAALVLFVAILSWPPAPPARAQFVQQNTFGGTSTNSGNAYSIAVPNWTTTLVDVPLQFIPNADNTGPVTINVSGVGAVNVYRPSSIGLVALSGHEFKTGVLTTINYDGTQYEIQGPLDMRPIGDTIQYRGSSVPPGYLIEDGSCVSQTTYAALFSVISSTYGSCSAGLFALPDSRGTAFMALDGQGVNGSAGRITTATCSTPNTVNGAVCGGQTQTLTQAQLPFVSLSSSSLSASSSSSSTTTPSISLNYSENAPTSGVGSAYQLGGPGTGTGGPGIAGLSVSASTSTTTTTTISGSVPLGGSGTAHPILNPTVLGYRAIKY